MRIYKKILLFTIVGLIGNVALAQNSRSLFWSASSLKFEDIQQEKWDTHSIPFAYKTFELDINAFYNQIKSAPHRNESKSTSGIVIDFPDLMGTYESYEVYDAPVLEESLQEQLPDVRSFIGRSLREQNKIIRFSVSAFGLNAIILNDVNGTQYIDCITKDQTNYIMYYKEDMDPLDNQVNCLTDDNEFRDQLPYSPELASIQYRNADDGTLREFRLALACTEEFSNYYVAVLGLSTATDMQKKDGILNVMNDFMTGVNAVYENEISITMTIIPNNRDVIFLQDAFLTNNNIGALIDESQQFIDLFAGSNTYDIGHMLSTSGSGLAQVFSPCTSNKARAVSGGLGGPPIGTVYENVILHEMGHQYGAFHTWSAPGCSGTYTDFSATEPGGGTTIMAYAGICGSQANIQPVSDDYFHQISLQQMWLNITVGNSTCASQTSSFNNPPIVDAGMNYTIPVGTPYKLEGIANDPDGNSTLTYCWEQVDVNGPEALPTTATTAGPVTRSFPPETSNVRNIPRLEDYKDFVNFSKDWEELVLIPRNMTFAFTVRDNDIAGGQTASDQMTVTLVGNSGPFRVTSQNFNNIQYDGNTIQTVTWSVANTNVGTVGTANVNILLSTDGGLTFDTVVVANTPNDGSEDVVIPNVNSTTCRFMVEASDNIFYNINTRDFQINEVLNIDEQTLENYLFIHPNPNNGEFSIELRTPIMNPINIEIYDIRGRVIYKKQFHEGGEFNELIQLKNAQSGVYLLGITYGNIKLTRKIIIE